MPYLVQKFGGTSVGTVEHIRRVAARAIAAKRAGFDVAVVVSAMAKETDRLVDLAASFSTPPSREEADVVASTGETLASALTALAIGAQGEKARSLLGYQIPIVTDSNFSQARILSVESAQILSCFQRGEIPVIAGFQGVDAQGRVTTLGRGGSDTTAVAIAAALGAALCEIYTDVNGVYSADPRICDEAMLLPQVSYRFMIEAAGLGAKIMHDRSVSIGMRYQVPIVIKSSFCESTGTTIGPFEVPTNCVTLDPNVVRVSFLTPDPLPELAHTLSRLFVRYTMLSQPSKFEKVAVVAQTDVTKLASYFRGRVLFADREVAKVSLVGTLAGNPAYQIPHLLTTMRRNHIDCHGLSAGALSVSFLIAKKQASETVQLFHSLCTKSAKEIH